MRLFSPPLTQLKTPFAGLTRRSVRWCVFFFFFFVNWRGINSLKNRWCIFSIHFSISYLTFVFPRFQEFCLWGNCLVSIIRLPDGIKAGLRPSCCFFLFILRVGLIIIIRLFQHILHNFHPPYWVDDMLPNVLFSLSWNNVAYIWDLVRSSCV